MADTERVGRWYSFDERKGYEVRRVGDCFLEIRIKATGRVIRLNHAEFDWLRSHEPIKPRGLE